MMSHHVRHSRLLSVPLPGVAISWSPLYPLLQGEQTEGDRADQAPELTPKIARGLDNDREWTNNGVLHET